jgi:hypothetical protein
MTDCHGCGEFPMFDWVTPRFVCVHCGAVWPAVWDRVKGCWVRCV